MDGVLIFGSCGGGRLIWWVIHLIFVEGRHKLIPNPFSFFSSSSVSRYFFFFSISSQTWFSFITHPHFLPSSAYNFLFHLRENSNRPLRLKHSLLGSPLWPKNLDSFSHITIFNSQTNIEVSQRRYFFQELQFYGINSYVSTSLNAKFFTSLSQRLILIYSPYLHNLPTDSFFFSTHIIVF